MLKVMVTSDSPFITDWFAVSLRWLTVLGLTVSLALGGLLISPAGFILGVLVLWNIALMTLAGLNRRFTRHREAGVIMDLAAAVLFFVAQGGFDGPAWWVVILPILSSTLYFEWKGALVASGLMAVMQVAVTWVLAPQHLLHWITGGSVLLTLLLGIVFAYLSRKLVEQLRLMRQKQIEAREKRQRVENERLRAIYNLTATLTGTLNYQHVLEEALTISLKALNRDPEAEPDNRLVCAVMLFQGDDLVVGASRGLTLADQRSVLPGREGLLARVIEEGTPELEQQPEEDPELGRLVAFRGCRVVYCFPLRSGLSVYGVMLFGHPQPGYFSPDRTDVLNIIGHQAVIAIQNARLYQDLVDEKQRMIEVQEEARKKLARDLHDGPTQSVSAIAMRVNLARRMLERDPQAALEELGKIEDLARRTTKEIRHMLFTLRPLVLESQGLEAALQAMAEKMKETFGQTVLVKVDAQALEQLELGKQGVIFYIVEEAVNNARKHAQAPHIWVRLRPLEKEPEIILLEIADDGVGFDVEAVTRSYDRRGSLGMINLRERTELVNGMLNLESVPGKGTRVQVYIPLTETAADRLHRARK
ncbi:MAG: GAF domain-containing sensor histidine kinase [Anaerolineales bacterium]